MWLSIVGDVGWLKRCSNGQKKQPYLDSYTMLGTPQPCLLQENVCFMP
ncbi:Uncharacterised protein [Yersinia intermedia]|nr:Uncharacterised protein [Yersinia intermedia]